MQVTSSDAYATHVLITKQESQTFRIDTNPEFVHVLSSSLYSDQINAVVREIICNAWDAHKASNKTDIPIEITLTDSELIITDFGTGIPNDQIVDIYCVYGASTKKNQANQTGGFGLGSKAPFAYSDFFDIKNRYGGKEVLYNAVKSSPLNNGLPAVTTVYERDTDQSGISISIPIKEEDSLAFYRKIVSLVFFGSINAVINTHYTLQAGIGEHKQYALPTIDRKQVKHNSYFIENNYVTWEYLANFEPIYICYGDILYPINQSMLLNVSAELTFLIKSICRVFNKKILVIYAEPNSLAIQPSREAFSYTPSTIKVLEQLIQDAYSYWVVQTQKHITSWTDSTSFKPFKKELAVQIINKQITDAVNEGKPTPPQLFELLEQLSVEISNANPGIFYNKKTFLTFFDNEDYYRKHIGIITKFLQKSEARDLYKINFKKLYKYAKQNPIHAAYTYLIRDVYAPLLKHLKSVPKIDRKVKIKSFTFKQIKPLYSARERVTAKSVYKLFNDRDLFQYNWDLPSIISSLSRKVYLIHPSMHIDLYKHLFSDNELGVHFAIAVPAEYASELEELLLKKGFDVDNLLPSQQSIMAKQTQIPEPSKTKLISAPRKKPYTLPIIKPEEIATLEEYPTYSTNTDTTYDLAIHMKFAYKPFINLYGLYPISDNSSNELATIAYHHIIQNGLCLVNKSIGLVRNSAQFDSLKKKFPQKFDYISAITEALKDNLETYPHIQILIRLHNYNTMLLNRIDYLMSFPLIAKEIKKGIGAASFKLLSETLAPYTLDCLRQKTPLRYLLETCTYLDSLANTVAREQKSEDNPQTYSVLDPLIQIHTKYLKENTKATKLVEKMCSLHEYMIHDDKLISHIFGTRDLKSILADDTYLQKAVAMRIKSYFSYKPTEVV